MKRRLYSPDCGDPQMRAAHEQGWATGRSPTNSSCSEPENALHVTIINVIYGGCGSASARAEARISAPVDQASSPNLSRHNPMIRSRIQRWAGSAEKRGCHNALTAISGVSTGSAKPRRRGSVEARKNDRGTRATRSASLARRSASSKPGTTATILRRKPRLASAWSTMPCLCPFLEATTWRNAA